MSQQNGNKITPVRLITPVAAMPGNPEESAALARGADRDACNIDDNFEVIGITLNWTVAA